MIFGAAEARGVLGAEDGVDPDRPRCCSDRRRMSSVNIPWARFFQAATAPAQDRSAGAAGTGAAGPRMQLDRVDETVAHIQRDDDQFPQHAVQLEVPQVCDTSSSIERNHTLPGRAEFGTLGPAGTGQARAAADRRAPRPGTVPGQRSAIGTTGPHIAHDGRGFGIHAGADQLQAASKRALAMKRLARPPQRPRTIPVFGQSGSRTSPILRHA